MIDLLKNKWTIGIIVFALATIAIYLFVPLFKISIFSIDTGWDYIKLVGKMKNASNVVSLLLPVIGGVGAVACALFKGRGPHILTVAFALLPVMFFVYLIFTIDKHVDVQLFGKQLLSVFNIVGKGIWLGLLSSFLALAASVMQAFCDWKGQKKKLTIKP